MSYKYSLLLATAALFVTSVFGNNEPDLVGARVAANFSCNGLPDGYYSHPSKCFSYIYCTEETRAYEFDCNIGMDGRQLHFLTKRLPGQSDLCGAPEVACCGCHPEPTTPTTTTKTTPTTTPTTTTPSTTTPAPGDCDPDICKLDGYCDCYEECVKVKDGVGRLVQKNCTQDLFWLPNDLTGGTCAYFDNLPGDIQDKYRNDATCIEKCEWFQRPEDICSPRYTYRKEFDGHTNIGREVNLACPPSPPGRKPLFWIQSLLVCGSCDDAVDNNGNACDCS